MEVIKACRVKTCMYLFVNVSGLTACLSNVRAKIQPKIQYGYIDCPVTVQLYLNILLSNIN